MTDEDEIPEVEQAEPPEEPLFGPDGALDCIDGRYALIESGRIGGDVWRELFAGDPASGHGQVDDA